MDILKIIGREQKLFESDISYNEKILREIVVNSKFLVIGAAGSIGQAVSKEIFKRNPKILHVIDIAENNMVELVRDIRSTVGYIDGEFRTFTLDCGSAEFQSLLNSVHGYDYVLNLSALKHVRIERDPFSLMNLIRVNILNTVSTIQQAKEIGAGKYFCVSTDKAANPVNMMGASKRIMEMYLMQLSMEIPISTARFANVAFSDGSLLHGFNLRILKQQPLAAPNDVRRYFVTPQESGELCLMSCLLGENRDIFFPKLSQELNLISFAEIAQTFLRQIGYEPFICESEEEARMKTKELIPLKKWPCFFFSSDTTGEKDFEEFFTAKEKVDMSRFSTIGVIKNKPIFDEDRLSFFMKSVLDLRHEMTWSKQELVDLFNYMIPEFNHLETGKYLDQKM